MTDKQIEILIHKEILGLTGDPLPYCNDLNAVAKVEQAVIGKVGEAKYWDALYANFNFGDMRHATLEAATAVAAIRALSCLRAMQIEL